MRSPDPIRVLFVCMGNICRSPMAEAVFRHQVAEAGLADRFEVDSAGTHGYHVGDPPHRETQAELARRGVEVGDQRSRQLHPTDLDEYDYVVVMDQENLDGVRALARGRETHAVVCRLLDGADAGRDDVPDPYYAGGYDHVYDLVEAGCENLLRVIGAAEGFAYPR